MTPPPMGGDRLDIRGWDYKGGGGYLFLANKKPNLIWEPLHIRGLQENQIHAYWALRHIKANFYGLAKQWNLTMNGLWIRLWGHCCIA